MNKLQRYGLGLPLAGAITLGLTVSMAQMIATEFKAQDKLETLDFAINVVPDDIVVDLPQTKLEKLKDVEVPPAPPVIDKGTTDAVIEPIIEIVGGLPDIDPTIIKIAGPVIIPIDSNPQPIFRSAPTMPSRADRSGHCNVRFNVSAEGAPYNIQATFCSESIFKRSTLKSVAKWKYRPKMQNGRAVAMQGVTNRVTYRLKDENGNIIPE